MMITGPRRLMGAVTIDSRRCAAAGMQSGAHPGWRLSMRSNPASLISAAAAALACVLATAAPPGLASGPPATSDWPATLEADARAFHAALRDRHPGPVDPENPDFTRLLDEALSRALERVPDTRDYGGYWWALREL